MKKIIFPLLLLVILLNGYATSTAAETADSTFYTDPSSPGYTQQVWGGLCEKCNRDFKFSSQQLDTLDNVACPYCKKVQNLKMAYNRFREWVVQPQSQQQPLQAQQQALQDHERAQSSYLKKTCRETWNGNLECEARSN
ncbi:MAG: hypothetical protein ABH865_06995 [Candidatus Omnitrophota bacterium]|nr:hypothetical protein [Candidatus Omnitrophota bacterium]